MRRLVALLGCTCLALACRHTQRVEAPGSERSDGAHARGKKEEQGGTGKATSTRVPARAGHPAVAASPEELMQPGSALRIQEALRARGLLREPASGELDEPTSAALRRFQGQEHLAQTGAPDRETLRRLGIDPQGVYRSVPEGREAAPRP
ncbi:peptidoglycan-binding domain-containing protein [Anaeromyxobacter diazotrophicus]|uniref:Peptidoglycan binding-like domain-containing protein n=1 Tax=Anaeromyxobacter diazotrophicus TaxID=2590199 RepID=A0A7I9VJ19_9BACT|nr:peptidoglycan-binding domain-containing protein [Anaeromyxobacter diazotrophicus]GEJ56120.1 hypothetical protein AMYX_08610 [Anaeromyxobacter diazotrophicus]